VNGGGTTLAMAVALDDLAKHLPLALKTLFSYNNSSSNNNNNTCFCQQQQKAPQQ
jgi:hypothetical protein